MFGKTAAQPQVNQTKRQPENQKTAFSGCRFIWKDCSAAIIQSNQRQPEKHITHPCAALSQYCAGKNLPIPFSGCLTPPNAQRQPEKQQ
nr:hypothetical protein [uncultured Kingella sp.]